MRKPPRGVIEIGQTPPWMMAFCGSCKQIVEAFAADPAKEPGRFAFHARCHGKTETAYVDEAYLRRRWALGEPFIMFKGPLSKLVNAVVAKHAR